MREDSKVKVVKVQNLKVKKVKENITITAIKNMMRIGKLLVLKMDGFLLPLDTVRKLLVAQVVQLVTPCFSGCFVRSIVEVPPPEGVLPLKRLPRILLSVSRGPRYFDSTLGQKRPNAVPRTGHAPRCGATYEDNIRMVDNVQVIAEDPRPDICFTNHKKAVQ